MAATISPSVPGAGARPTGPARDPWWDRAGTATLVLAGLSVAALFALRSLPELDLAAARPFFEPRECAEGAPAGAVCGAFPLAYDATALAVRRVAYWIPYSAAIAAFLWLGWLTLLRAGKTVDDLRRALLAPLTVLLGPVLLVNVILKGQWGRPRPFQSEPFGGDAPFVLPGTLSDGCTSNCSFVSGEVSSAAWMLALVFLLPARLRWPAAAAVVAFTVAVSAGRIAFGRHYLSDAVMAALLTATIVTATAWLLTRRPVLAILRRWTVASNARLALR